MRRQTRPGIPGGHKKDYLIRGAEEQLKHGPDEAVGRETFDTGGAPDEAPIWQGGHYGRGTDARGLRRRNVKRAGRKGQRRARHVTAGKLALGRDVESRVHST